MSAVPVHPVRVDGTLDPSLSRWLWLVKWLLVIPHAVVLAFLWIAFFVLSAIALVAILFTGRYPRGLFAFNVGVLRWTWRVGFYSFSALGTDRYPPFTLADVPDYPAALEIPYPEHLSRGLVLVKWWLLALPHYILVGIFVGGGAWAVTAFDGPWLWGTGLVGILVLIAGVGLLFTGRYPRGIFDLVLGLDRWVIRVAAYAGLMTDAYPPFRLDLGGSDPGTVAIESRAPATPTAGAPRWGAGRSVVVVLGAIATLVALALLVTGGAAVVIDQTQRDESGFVMSPTEEFATPAYAIVSESVDVSVDGPDWAAESFLGTVRIRSVAQDPVFVGIARESAVESYLMGVRHAVVTEIGPGHERYAIEDGGAPAERPGDQTFWAASTTGFGTQTLEWEPEDGSWQVVVMHVDGSPTVAARLSVGAELDPLLWVGIGLVAGGVVLLVAAAGAIYVAVPRVKGGEPA